MTNKKKNNKSFYLLIWLMLTTFLLTTTTYAWFTANRIVSLNSLNVQVRSAGGIEISADGTTWKAVLSIQDLINAHLDRYPTSTNQLPSVLTAVSTGGIIDPNTGFLNMYSGMTTNNLEGYYILASTRTIETEGSGDTSNGHFVAFDLFLKAASPKQLYLTDLSTVRHRSERSYGIENAARIAFVVQGNVPVETELSTVQALRATSNDAVYIWEPNYDAHTNEAIANAYSVYDLSIQNRDERIVYDGVISEFSRDANITLSRANAINFPRYFQTVEVDYATTIESSGNTPIFSINSGITKIRVYMWLEGQDVDCENNASFGDMSFALQITTDIS